MLVIQPWYPKDQRLAEREGLSQGIVKNLEKRIRLTIREIRNISEKHGYSLPKEIFFRVDKKLKYPVEYEDEDTPILHFGRASIGFSEEGFTFIVAHEIYHIIDSFRKGDSLSQERFLDNPTKTGWREQKRIAFRAEFHADAFAQKILSLLGHHMCSLPENGSEGTREYQYGEMLLKAKHYQKHKKDFNVRSHPSTIQRNRALQKNTLNRIQGELS